MITLYVGPKNKNYETIKQRLAEQCSNNVHSIDTAFQDASHISEIALTTSMFDPVSLYIVNSLDSEVLTDTALPMAQSENHFLVTIESMLAPVRKKLEKIFDSVPASRVTWQVQDKEKAKAPTINPFGIANLLPTGDRKKLFVMLAQLKNAGLEAENIHGILFWKLKDMYSKTKIPSEQNTIRNHMKTLVHGYHNVRRSGGDMWNMIEQWILQYKK